MAEPIRVLQVVTQMNRAGLECLLMGIYRNIDRERIQFDFLTFRTTPGYFDDEIISLGGRVFYLSPITVLNMRESTKRVSNLLKKHPEYQIVHAHMNQWCGAIFKGAKKAGTPVRIAHSHTSLEKFSIKNSIKNLVKISTNFHATQRFAVSKKAGRWLFGKRAITEGKVTVWPNAIDCGKFQYSPETRKITRSELGLLNEFTLIHVGNLRPEKNHKFLIDILTQTKLKYSNTVLLLVGKDLLNGAIQSYARERQVERDIMFLGARNDIPELLQAGDVFVFPSFYEGFPVAVLEAQAADLPCVISNTITKEVCLTENIVQLPINKAKELWVKQISAFKDIIRTDNAELLRSKGYDIHALCKRMEVFYETSLS